MIHFSLKARVNADGMLSLDIPTGLPETEVDVVVVLNPLPEATSIESPEALGWPPGFFDETFGLCREEPLTRLPQGEPDIREPIS